MIALLHRIFDLCALPGGGTVDEIVTCRGCGQRWQAQWLPAHRGPIVDKVTLQWARI